jgi:predicted ArsR family transcriptional regulator
VFLVDVLSGVAQPELREIALFARAQARPVSADDVAARFRIHRTVARGRLDRLAAAGLLTVSFERRSGRSGPGAGRPTKLYSVPPETAAIEFPRRHYDRLLARLLDVVPEQGRELALTDAGAVFGADLAVEAGLARTRGIRSAAERACAALGRLGFQAFVSESTEDTITITTSTCPLRPLVVANPEAAHIDRGMWMGLVDAYLPRSRACNVSCETQGCLDSHESCRVLLTCEADSPTTARHP